jgi:hypothetical protein
MFGLFLALLDHPETAFCSIGSAVPPGPLLATRLGSGRYIYLARPRDCTSLSWQYPSETFPQQPAAQEIDASACGRSMTTMTSTRGPPVNIPASRRILTELHEFTQQKELLQNLVSSSTRHIRFEDTGSRYENAVEMQRRSRHELASWKEQRQELTSRMVDICQSVVETLYAPLVNNTWDQSPQRTTS